MRSMRNKSMGLSVQIMRSNKVTDCGDSSHNCMFVQVIGKTITKAPFRKYYILHRGTSGIMWVLNSHIHYYKTKAYKRFEIMLGPMWMLI
jgi:hypothetical protein